MEDKKTTILVKESTLYNFNCAKVENKFKTADDFILYLLCHFSKLKGKVALKPMEKQEEKETFKKELSVKELEKNNNQKKMADKNNKKYNLSTS